MSSSEGTVGLSDDDEDGPSMEESVEEEEGSAGDELRETLDESVSVELDAVEASSGGITSGGDEVAVKQEISDYL